MQTHAPKTKVVQPAAAQAKKSSLRHAAITNRDVAELRENSSRPTFDYGKIPFYAAAPQHGGLYRAAAGAAPAVAPPIVDEVLRSEGRPMPVAVRRDMEAQLAHNFTDVRVHTDERAGASATAVSAHAYTVGRHIVFAPGRFKPETATGRRLLIHELVHAAGHPPRAPTPSGSLRISTPADSAERHAVNVAQGGTMPHTIPATPAGLHRDPAFVGLASGSVNFNQVTTPPESALNFSAAKVPVDATDVTLAVRGDTATIAAGTAINNSTGAIKVAAGQTGGSAHVEATQNRTDYTPTVVNIPFTFVGTPGAIRATGAVKRTDPDAYGGDFTHTFTAPGGGKGVLDGAHVNEKFDGGSGTSLTIKGALGTAIVNINDPDSTADGWDLDDTGTMGADGKVGTDEVSWGHDVADIRPFVANASNPRPKALPKALTVTQKFRNLSYPSQNYGANTIASTTHSRGIEERSKSLVAVTSAGLKKEIVEPYAGPTVWRHARAAATSIPAAAPAPATATTTTITVDAEGETATPTFSINTPDLDCTITQDGVLTPGSTVGKVKVRAGDSDNYDETTVKVTAAVVPAQPVAAPAETAP